MAIKRVVNTEFWTDKKVVEQFSPEDRYFMLYLLTNPHTTQLGIYPFINKVAAFETGYNAETIANLIERFQEYGIIKTSKSSGEIAVKNFLRHSIMKGGAPVFDLLVKEASNVKDSGLLRFVLEVNKSSTNDTVRKFANIELKRLPNENGKHNENANDNDNDNDILNENDNANENEESYHESHNESSRVLSGEYFDLGPMGYVKLSADEYLNLVRDLGQDELDRVIAYVDESAKMTDNKNGWKDWNTVLRKASRENWGI